VTRKKRTTVRYRFANRDEVVALADVLYQELLQDARVVSAPPAEFDPRHRAAATARLRAAAEAMAEKALRVAQNPPRHTPDRIKTELPRHPTQYDAGAELGIAPRTIRKHAPGASRRLHKKRKP
jgi:hypothetical protein